MHTCFLGLILAVKHRCSSVCMLLVLYTGTYYIMINQLSATADCCQQMALEASFSVLSSAPCHGRRSYICLSGDCNLEDPSLVRLSALSRLPESSVSFPDTVPHRCLQAWAYEGNARVADAPLPLILQKEAITLKKKNSVDESLVCHAQV